MPISDAEYEKIKSHLADKNWRMRNLYYIRNKRGQVVLFTPNDEQTDYRANKHGRDIILKARQLGFTTESALDKLDNCLFNSNYHAGIICDTSDNAEKIFHNKVKFAFDLLPEWLKERRKPNTDRSGELRFPNGSSISVSTGYRGGTLSSLHVSEYGRICRKYPDKAKEIKAGAFEAVPLNGEITVESTAEGMSGDFFEMYEVAAKNYGKELTVLDFKLHFYPWWKSGDYRLSPVGVEISQEMLTYFKYLKEEQSIELDEWQKAWYVKKAENQEDIKQEYPSYPEEAFLASGRLVFNGQKLARDILRAKARKFTIKNFEVRGKLYPVKIYHEPVTGKPYALGADVAEGLEEGDDSTLSVVDKEYRQCASFCGTIDPSDHGRLIVAVAKYYNSCIVAPEVNNHGHATLAAIKEEKYFRIYRRSDSDEELGKDIKDKVGWLSTAKSKMKYLDDLREAYKHDETEINDEATLREMMTLVIEETGDIIMNGKDRTVAHGIAIQAAGQATIPDQFKAVVPGKAPTKDVTKMSIEEKMKYYKRMQT